MKRQFPQFVQANLWKSSTPFLWREKEEGHWCSSAGNFHVSLVTTICEVGLWYSYKDKPKSQKLNITKSSLNQVTKDICAAGGWATPCCAIASPCDHKLCSSDEDVHGSASQEIIFCSCWWILQHTVGLRCSPDLGDVVFGTRNVTFSHFPHELLI